MSSDDNKKMYLRGVVLVRVSILFLNCFNQIAGIVFLALCSVRYWVQCRCTNNKIDMVTYCGLPSPSLGIVAH